MQTEPEIEPVISGDQVITRGSTWAAIWHMVWPLTINMVLFSLAGFCDVWVAGKISSDAQAAVGIASQIGFLMFLIIMALCVGSTAIISRFWGAKEWEEAIVAARHALIFALGFGLFSTIAALLFSRWLFRTLGASASVEALGWQFMFIFSLALMPIAFVWTSNSVFRAIGSARAPMLVSAISTVLIAIGEIGMCVWPFHLGVAALGFAWLLANLVASALLWYLLSQTALASALQLWHVSLSSLRSWFKRILSIGLPASVEDAAYMLGNFAMFLIFAQISNPTACQASWAIGVRVDETMLVMPVFALKLAAATIVGQNLGALEPERSHRSAWQLAFCAVGFAGLIAVLWLIGAGFMARSMSSDPAVIQATTSYFLIQALFEPFFALYFVLFGAMQGAGYTRVPMIISLFVLVIVRLPLAWFLAVNMHMQVQGCWWSLSITQVTLAVATIWLFRRGTWKKQEV